MVIRISGSLLSKFMSKVVSADPPSTCWLWTGALNHDGYGYFGKVRAHRWAYEFQNGPIPANLELDHVRMRDGKVLCTHRHCVNPAHLEPVTHAENMRRRAPYEHVLMPGLPAAFAQIKAQRGCAVCGALGSRTAFGKCRVCGAGL